MTVLNILPPDDATSAAGAMLMKQARGPIVVCVMLAGLQTSAAHAMPVDLLQDSYVAGDETTAGVSIREEATVASCLSELRRRSGLTWDQLARLLGVSRRSLHFWASGKPLAPSNEEHLQRVLSVIRAIDRGSSNETRANLLQATKDGALPIDLLAAREYARVRMDVGPRRSARPAVPALSKEARVARAPLRPGELIDELGDRTHQGRGRVRLAKSVKVKGGRER